jgi:hypothetical protein
MRIQRIEIPGRMILADPENPGIFYTGQDVLTGFSYERGQWKTFLEIEINRPINQMCLDKMAYIWITSFSDLFRLEFLENGETRLTPIEGDKGLPDKENLRLFTDPESGLLSLPLPE